jgi:hypothetical protein
MNYYIDTGKNADQLLKEATKLTPDAAIKKITISANIGEIKSFIKMIKKIFT